MALARWLMLGMLLLGCLVGIGSAVAVTGPVVIEKPGTYELTKDILGSKEPVCIEIRCDDVVLDGKGHLIRGVDAANSAGILVHGSGPVSNVVIRNIRTQDYFYGIYFWGVHNGRIDGATASDNYFGLAFNPASDSTVSDSRFTSNSYGVVLTGSTRNQLTGCRITGNAIAGISIYGSTANTIANNLFQNKKNVFFVNGATPGNRWSVERRDGPNIVGGRIIGGNCWLDPAGGGVSAGGEQKDGLLTTPYRLNDENVDYLPLAAHPEGASPGPTDTPTPGETAKPDRTPTPGETPTPKVTRTATDSGIGSRPFIAIRSIPGTIQAEDYDLGGPGRGYFTPAPVSNTVYRNGTIAIRKNDVDGGYYLTGTRFREWLRYTVDVRQTGDYQVTARVSSLRGGQWFKIIDECHPQNRVTVWVPATGKDTFRTTRPVRLHLEEGVHTLKVFSYGSQDMDSFTFS
ncbi:MAG TPA: NosD domain-containing protein [Methanoregulaceae archaeon]|nr:NosD domain-containing protein [Methanoregulaceae archaeon]